MAERATPDIFGVRIQKSAFLPEGTMIAFGGNFDLPPEWATMTPEMRFRYALAHGAALVTAATITHD